MQKVISLSFVFSAMLAAAVKAQDYQVSLQNIPTATQTQVNTWNETKNLLLGIRGHDPQENTPPSKTQAGTFGLLTTTKKNFSGIFNRYGTEEESHGYDWNFMIEPFAEFKYIYDLATQSSYSNKSKWPGIIPLDKLADCSDRDYIKDKPAVMAEICPYHRFLNDNIWFKGTNNDHCKDGTYLKSNDTLAVYGCPVNDNNHGYNPEIHPAQQLWFRNKGKTNANNQSYFLIFIQDASERFGNWVNSPLYGQYKIAFKLNPNVRTESAQFKPLMMNISIARKYDLITNRFATYSQDSDDGFSHSLVVNGKKVLTVNEPQADDNLLGIKFVEITRLSNGMIQGYVEISMVLGDYNTDEIGVCVLELNVVKESALPSIGQ